MVPKTKVEVRLTDDQRETLDPLVQTGSHPAAMWQRGNILLLSDAEGPDAWSDDDIAERLETSRMTVQRVRQQFADGGFDATFLKLASHGTRTANTSNSLKFLVGMVSRSVIACSGEGRGRTAGRWWAADSDRSVRTTLAWFEVNPNQHATSPLPPLNGEPRALTQPFRLARLEALTKPPKPLENGHLPRLCQSLFLNGGKEKA